MKTIKESYILLLIVLGLVSLGIYTTYAMFTASTTINDVVGITTTLDIGKSLTEYEIVVVEPNETKLIELNVINSYNDNIYYGAWYQIVQGNSEDIDIGLYTEKNSNPGSGVLSQNSNINLLAGITNDNSTSIIVYLGVKGSLTNELNLGSNKVLLPDGWSIVKNNAIDESGANYPDLVDGLVPVMYDGSKWVKADTKSSTSKYGWYDYNEKRWANAVLVNGETINDLSNNNNYGLIHNAVIEKDGLNITSDNSTYVTLPNDIGITFPMTYSITFNTNSTSNQVIFGDGNTKAGLGITNVGTNAQFIVVLGTENSTYTYNTGGIITNNDYTVDIVYHSLSDIEVYLNGNKLTKTTSKDFWSWTDNTKSYIGKRPSNVNNFSGIIKKFIVYDDELTLDEITHNYRVKNFDICDKGIICDNLKLYYNFVSSKNIVNDYSNNENTGLMYGTTIGESGLNITSDNNTYVELPYSIGATLPATYSITFSTDSTSNQVIFGDYNTKAGLGLINSNNQFIVVLGSENTTYTVNTGGLTLNKFYTVDIVYHSLSDIEVYLNGNKLTKTTSKDFWGWTDSKSYIGKRPSNVNNFSGIIKKFIVYDDELTLDEIVYNYGVTSHNICDNGIICDNLNLYYNFSSDEQINKDFYLNALPGTEVPIDEILAFYVWIPRFKYKVWNINKVIGTDSYNAYNTGIDIVFESEKKSTGIVNCTYSYNSPSSSANSPNETCTGSNGDYYTHPAFTFGSDNIRGFWIGKFELSNSGTSSNAIPKIIPNTEIWLDTSTTNQNITQFYNAIQNMQSEKNIYGLSMDKTNTDSHMITNYEWGAVAYLANSKYGRCTSGSCTNITINNCMISSDNTYTIIAGIGANSIADSSSETTCNNSTNKYNGTKGVLASTTGNITGVYDMSGGGGEYVMANISSTSGNYSFSSNKSDFLSSWYNITNNHKFVITYAYGTTSSDQAAYNRSRLGDATGEVVLSSGGSGGWYNDAAEFPPKGSMGDTSWFVRGGSFLEKDKAGLFYFRNYSCASFVCYHSTRASLVSLK